MSYRIDKIGEKYYFVFDDGVTKEVPDPSLIPGLLPVDVTKLKDSGKKASLWTYVLFLVIPLIFLGVDLLLGLINPTTYPRYFLLNGIITYVKELKYVAISFIIIVGIGRAYKKHNGDTGLVANEVKDMLGIFESKITTAVAGIVTPALGQQQAAGTPPPATNQATGTTNTTTPGTLPATDPGRRY